LGYELAFEGKGTAVVDRYLGGSSEGADTLQDVDLLHSGIAYWWTNQKGRAKQTFDKLSGANQGLGNLAQLWSAASQ
jgi:hypothetical protein